MSLRRKVAILSVLTCGICSVTVAILRLPVLVTVTSAPDTSYEVGKMIIVASFEVQAAIVAVNLPALKPIWKRIRRGSSAASKHDYSDKVHHELSSMEGRNSNKKKFDSTGSITRLERGITSTESEEELFQHAHNQSQSAWAGGEHLHLSNHNESGDSGQGGGDIKVTTQVETRYSARPIENDDRAGPIASHACQQ
jgi:hypothetical protein